MLRDEQKAEAEKLKDAPFQKKISYFFTYNKLPVIAVLASLCLIAGIVYGVRQATIEKLFVVITDQQGDTLNTDILSEQYTETSSAPFPVSYDTSLELAPKDVTETNVIAFEKLLALYRSQTIDVFLAPESVFENYGAEEMFLPLDTILTKEEFQKLKSQNRIVYVTLKDYSKDPDHPGKGETIPAGISLKGSPLAASCGLHLKNGCIGITYNTPHPDEALTYLRMFLNFPK